MLAFQGLGKENKITTKPKFNNRTQAWAIVSEHWTNQPVISKVQVHYERKNLKKGLNISPQKTMITTQNMKGNGQKK